MIFLLIFAWPALIFASIRIGIVSDSAYFGEREIGWRIKRAAENLGWEVFLDEQRGRLIQNMNDLDWTISLMTTSAPKPKCLNYMAIFHPFGLLDTENKIDPSFESFDGYLLTIKPEIFEGAFRSEATKFFSIPFYPTVQPIPYKKVTLNNLAVILPCWGHRRRNLRYKTLHQLLSQSGFARFYGPQDKEGIIRQGYVGQLPFDGSSIIKALQSQGITLILHSWHHRKKEIPSGRIFEAAAASTVIISDENPFVREHFGDSVYYIDVTLSPEEIFGQISDRMEEIFKNPEEALAKAEEAHRIFTNHFQMTDQLIAIQEMHTKILSEK